MISLSAGWPCRTTAAPRRISRTVAPALSLLAIASGIADSSVSSDRRSSTWVWFMGASDPVLELQDLVEREAKQRSPPDLDLGLQRHPERHRPRALAGVERRAIERHPDEVGRRTAL